MKNKKISDLLNIMSTLRDPEKGCIWDKQQTFRSIIPYTIDEVYEVAEAIEMNDFTELKNELGDLLFQVVFLSQIAKEEKQFDFDSVVDAISEKLIRRHPHVFSNVEVNSVEEQSLLWEEIKKQEKKSESNDDSILQGINHFKPGITVAKELQIKAAHVGFDWDNHEGPLEKVLEEHNEVVDAIEENDKSHIEEEMGDLLFACVNLARHLSIDPDQALKKSNIKFEKRFRILEEECQKSDVKLQDMSLSELNVLWHEAKKAARNY